MTSLDEKDRLLIRALQKNARASLVSLGRDIGLSRSATHDRITRLEETGIIRAYTVSIDETVMSVARAFLTIKLTTGNGDVDLPKIIAAKPGVKATYCLSGDIDMIAYCECDDVASLAILRDDLAGMEDVVEIQTRTIMTSRNGSLG